MNLISMLPTGRAGRSLAVALLCLVLGAGYFLLVMPVLEMYSLREGVLADKRKLAQRLEATAAELPGLRAKLAELQTAASKRKIVFEGTSDAIAAANLQSRIEELAVSTGVAIGSTEAVPGENRDGHRRIGLRLAVSGEYASIVKLLGAVENAAPPLVLGNLQIHAAARPTADASNARLDAGFEVYGFRSAETSSASQR